MKLKIILMVLVLIMFVQAQESEQGLIIDSHGVVTISGYPVRLAEGATLIPMFEDDLNFPIYEYEIKKVYSEEYKEHVLKPYIITTAFFVTYIIADVISDRHNYKRLERLIE